MQDWLSLYLLNNYGTCRLEKCMCRDPHKPRFGGPWVGINCPDWQPNGSKNWTELYDYIFKKELK